MYTFSASGNNPVSYPLDFRVSPMIAPAASFAIGTPVILLKNGTVLELRGLTSNTNTSPLLITYWIFNSPTMFNPFANLIVYSINLAFSPSVSV